MAFVKKNGQKPFAPPYREAQEPRNPLIFHEIDFCCYKIAEVGSLPNILSDEALIPEFLQYYCTPEAIAYSILEQLKPSRRAFLVERFTHMHETLLRPTASLACDAIARVLTHS